MLSTGCNSSLRRLVLKEADPGRQLYLFPAELTLHTRVHREEDRVPAHDALAFAPLGARVGRAPAISDSGSISSGSSTCRTGMPFSRSAWLIMDINSAMAVKSPSYTSWYRPSAL